MNFHITIIGLLTFLIINCCGLFQCSLAETGIYEIDGKIYELKDGADFSNLLLRNVRTVMPVGWSRYTIPGGATNYLIRGCTENPSSVSVIFTEFRFWCDTDTPHGTWRVPTTLRDVKFDNSDLQGAIFGKVHFDRCSFRGSNLKNLKELSEVENNSDYVDFIAMETHGMLTEFHDCDFTDAIIDGAYLVGITGENFRSTKTYKNSLYDKELVFEDELTLRESSLDGTNFEGYNLKNISFWCTSLKNCNFSGAYLENIFWSMPDVSGFDVMHEFRVIREHLLSSKNYKQGVFIGIRCSANFSDVDFSSTQFTNCNLGGDFANANFEDAVFTRTSLYGAKNLTVNQIKSTWNYKHNRMAGITLPESIQKVLDAEKEQRKSPLEAPLGDQ